MTAGREKPAPTVEVVEYTDPLCPWAWGSEPVFRRLRESLGGRVRWRRVYAILFDHDDDVPPDPAAETAWYARYVEGISAHTLAPRAVRLSRVAASSWPSSLVAKAAELQGGEVAEPVLRRLRETVFVLGDPADTLARALSAARGTPGLDLRRLAADAASEAVLDQVRADRTEARHPVPEVLPAREASASGGPGSDGPVLDGAAPGGSALDGLAPDGFGAPVPDGSVASDSGSGGPVSGRRAPDGPLPDGRASGGPAPDGSGGPGSGAPVPDGSVASDSGSGGPVSGRRAPDGPLPDGRASGGPAPDGFGGPGSGAPAPAGSSSGGPGSGGSALNGPAPSGSPHSGGAKEAGDGGYRYALPTLLIRAPAGYRVVPGWRAFEDYAAAFDGLCPGLLPDRGPLSPAAALAHYRSLTDPERRQLTRGPWPPPQAVRVDTGNGPLWLHPAEAAVHPATRG